MLKCLICGHRQVMQLETPHRLSCTAITQLNDHTCQVQVFMPVVSKQDLRIDKLTVVVRILNLTLISM